MAEFDLLLSVVAVALVLTERLESVAPYRAAAVRNQDYTVNIGPAGFGLSLLDGCCYGLLPAKILV